MAAAGGVVAAAGGVVAEAGGVVAGVADEPRNPTERESCRQRTSQERSTDMKSIRAKGSFSGLLWIVGALVCACLPAFGPFAAQPPTAAAAPAGAGAASASPRSFDSPHQAVVALVEASAKFDVAAIVQIFGPDGEDILFTGEPVRDRQRAADFAAEANEKRNLSADPKTADRVFLIVGKEEWPFPVPLVKRAGKWSFDIQAGRQELLYRRIGANELDAITICRGYVQAQYDYAFRKREGYQVHQYAQRLISSPGQQDGLAWRNPDGTWGGPVGENVARAIAQGYTGSRSEPYHGYFFKVLTGQGPAAPLGAMDFVVKGVMIGGFGLAAAPAEYEVTGVKTFIVSYEGIVYQKDLGPNTLAIFQKMKLYNPDKTWERTDDGW